MPGVLTKYGQYSANIAGIKKSRPRVLPPACKPTRRRVEPPAETGGREIKKTGWLPSRKGGNNHRPIKIKTVRPKAEKSALDLENGMTAPKIYKRLM